MHGKFIEEVDCFRYLGLHVPVDGGIARDVKFRINEVRKVYRGMKGV